MWRVRLRPRSLVDEIRPRRRLSSRAGRAWPGSPAGWWRPPRPVTSALNGRRARPRRSRRPGWCSTPAGAVRGVGSHDVRRHVGSSGRALRDAGELREAERVLTASLSLQNTVGRRTTRPGCAGPSSTWPSSSTGSASTRRPGGSGSSVLASSDRDEGPTVSSPGRRRSTWPSRCASSAATATSSPSGCACSNRPGAGLGPDNPETFRAEIDLAQTHRYLGNHDLALGLFTEALAGLERTGGDQRTILYQKWAIATELLALKRSKEASVMFDEVVGRRHGAPRPRRSVPAQCGPSKAWVLAAREVLRGAAVAASRQGDDAETLLKPLDES